MQSVLVNGHVCFNRLTLTAFRMGIPSVGNQVDQCSTGKQKAEDLL